MWHKIVSFVLLLGLAGQAALAANPLDSAAALVGSVAVVKKELNNKYQLFLNARGQELQLAEQLAPVELEVNTLAAQLAVLTTNADRVAQNMTAIQKATVAAQLQLSDLQELQTVRAVELAKNKALLTQFVQLTAAGQRDYLDPATGQLSVLRFLLAGGSLAATENQQNELRVLQTVAAELIGQLQAAQQKYAVAEQELLRKKGELIVLQENLREQQDRLEELRAAKARLLEETRGKETEYRQLIEAAAAEQARVLGEIGTLRSDLGTLQEKLTGLGKDLGAEQLAALLKEQGLTALNNNLKFTGNTPRLAWPVDAGRGITAYFHDPEYKAMFGVTHEAIDIRAPQGTPVGAAAPGVVLRTHENGLAYAYIAIAHAGGVSTVYGHISKILVKEGDVVNAGDVIGLSGAAPGSHGAGPMTTGPHLHFEVIEKDEHHDPLEYLPLEAMRPEEVPQKYVQK